MKEQAPAEMQQDSSILSSWFSPLTSGGEGLPSGSSPEGPRLFLQQSVFKSPIPLSLTPSLVSGQGIFSLG